MDKVVLPENNERITHQLEQDIRVIIGNPPYSAGQTSANDNNQNLDYPTLDGRIRDTYAELSSATNKNSLYDSYIRAIRWASDRLKKPGKDQGIVAFVTNGKFIESNVADGLRKCLTDEFSHLYVFNLRGFIRGKSGDDAKREGQNIFEIMTGVAITLLVKDPTHQGACELHYHDIGDYLTREDKLRTITEFGSMAGVPWQSLTPNAEGDWINARNPEFETFMELGNKEDKTDHNPQAIFSTYSCGVQTNRDTWVYNFQKDTVSSNMGRMISTYNNEVDRYRNACKGKSKDHYPELEKFVESDPKKISWSSSLLPLVARDRKADFSAESIIYALYRPFTKQWFYFDRIMNHRPYLMPRLFPTPEHHNVVISVTGIGGRKPFSALIANTLPDLELVEKGQCFPLYWYEKVEENGGKQQQPAQTSMFATWEQQNVPDEHGYIKREAITDWALQAFQERYGDSKITKEDIFSYVYGILHSPEYKSRFASDLKKMLPRIPFATDFWAFSNAGNELSQLHLRYETVEPFPLQEENKRMIMEAADYRVQKMAFGKTGGKPDKSVIVYNGNVTLRGIPLEAYSYVVNGKPALEWVMERYAVTKDKDSGITNDANQWSDDPRYIVELVKRVVTVSVESVRIVAELQGLGV